MKILLIEGMPGSGKSTLAKYISNVLNNSGIMSTWYLEESIDHPIHSRAIRKFSSSRNYLTICLDNWEKFCDIEKDRNTVHIMEGSAFQSTVRFMMEHEMEGIHGYFEKFIRTINPLSPAFLYLRPNNAIELSRIISKLRGEDWATKVSNYETKIPYSINHGFKGLEGMHNFWSKYAELCDSLLPLWKRPKKIINFNPGDWSAHKVESQSFINSLGFNVVHRENTG